MLVFEPGETKSFVEVPLSGRATDPREFSVALESDQSKAKILRSEGNGKVALGNNKTALVSIVCSQGGSSA